MGGRALTWLLVAAGIGGWMAAQIFYPLQWGNIPFHLAITGIAAIVGDVGLSRTPLGKESGSP